MTKRIARLVCLLMTVVLALAIFAGCKKDESNKSSSQVTSQNTTSIKPTEEFELYNEDGLPKDLDLGGVTLKVAGPNEGLLFPSEKEVAKSTLAERRAEWIEEVCTKYNFTMEFVHYDVNSIPTVLMADLLSGDSVADICLPIVRQAGGFIQSRLCMDLRSEEMAEYLDFEKPWWDKTMLKASSVDGATYCCTPHFTTSADTTWVCYFNKAVLTEIGVDDDTLYDLQENYKWNWSEFTKYCKMAVKDLNDDGQMTKDDRWGFITADWHIFHNLCTAGGLNIIKTRDDGSYYVDLNNAQALTTLGQINNLLANDNIFLSQGIPDMWNSFANGNTLFMIYQAQAVRQDVIREMEDDFGIVLTPMGPDVDSYMARAEQTSTTCFVPATSVNIRETAIALQALAYASWYYGVQDTLELNFLQYTRDDRSEWAITNVFNYTTYETDQLMYSIGVGGTWVDTMLSGSGFYRACITKNGDISGGVLSISDQLQGILDTFYNQATGE